MLYIQKDVNETLDYVFIRTIDDTISSVTYTQSAGATLTVQSCATNVNVIEDSNGNSYPAGSAIILWVTGGTIGSIETVTLTLQTVAGRVIEEKVTFTLVEGC